MALQELKTIITYMNQSGVPLPPNMAAACAAAASIPSLQSQFNQEILNSHSFASRNRVSRNKSENSDLKSKLSSNILDSSLLTPLHRLNETSETNKLISVTPINCLKSDDKS